MTKRWIRVAALAAATAMALGACGGSGDDPGGDDEKATISLQLSGDPAEIEAYRELIAAFETAHPAITVDLIPVGKSSDHMAKLATAFSGGTPPDLFLLNFRRFGQFAGKGAVEPLASRLEASTVLDKDDFYPQALDAFVFDGEQTCLPQNISSLVVYYNKALFTEHNVPLPKAGWTRDDFLAAAKALTLDTDGDGTTDVYGLSTEPSLIRVAPFVWQSGGEVVDNVDAPTGFTLLADRTKEALGFFIGLRRVHGVTPPLEEAESEDEEARFTNGRLGMLMNSRKVVPTLREVEGLDWDVAPLPQDAGAATILHSDAYCMSAASKNKDAAFTFVEFALGPEGSPIIARTGRTVPSTKTVAESDAFLTPGTKPASAQVFLDVIPTIRRVPNIAAWHEIESKADEVIEEWYYGTEPIEALGVEITAVTSDLFPKGGA